MACLNVPCVTEERSHSLNNVTTAERIAASDIVIIDIEKERGLLCTVTGENKAEPLKDATECIGSGILPKSENRHSANDARGEGDTMCETTKAHGQRLGNDKGRGDTLCETPKGRGGAGATKVREHNREHNASFLKEKKGPFFFKEKQALCSLLCSRTL